MVRQTSTAVHATGPLNARRVTDRPGQHGSSARLVPCERSIFEQGYFLLAVGQEQKLAIGESESGCRSDVI